MTELTPTSPEPEEMLDAAFPKSTPEEEWNEFSTLGRQLEEASVVLDGEEARLHYDDYPLSIYACSQTRYTEHNEPRLKTGEKLSVYIRRTWRDRDGGFMRYTRIGLSWENVQGDEIHMRLNGNSRKDAIEKFFSLLPVWKDIFNNKEE